MLQRLTIGLLSLMLAATPLFNVKEVQASHLGDNDHIHELSVSSWGSSYLVLAAELSVSTHQSNLKLFSKKEGESDYSVVHEVPYEDMHSWYGVSFYQHTVQNLDPHTTYDFVLKSYDQNNQELDSESARGFTSGEMTVHSIYPKNARVGDTLLISGENFGSNETLSELKVGPTSCIERDEDCFYIYEHSNNLLRVEIPYGMAGSMSPYEHTLYIQHEYTEYPVSLDVLLDESETATAVTVSYEPYELSEKLNLIASVFDYYNPTIKSNYSSSGRYEDYVYLNNALAYRYGKKRTMLSKEQAAAQDFRNRMKQKLGRDIGVDALWFLNLFNASYYGGYSDDDIVKEVLHGPCAVNATIPKSAWKHTPEYSGCGQ